MAGTAVSAASIGGCLGGMTSGNTETTTDGPQPPWTTEELASQVSDGTKVTIYAGSGVQETWTKLVDIINDEFDVQLEADPFVAGGHRISQRFIQERQADNDQADVATVPSDIREQIATEGESVARKYFEWDMDTKFWFQDILPDERLFPWMVSSYAGGAGSVMPVNTEIFEEQGLDYPTSYNDLFEDQYEGLEMIMPASPNFSQIGWTISYHASKTNMSNEEWITSLLDQFEISTTDSHSTGTRRVATGKAALMYYAFGNTPAPLIKDPEFPIKGIFVDPVYAQSWSGPLYINNEAQHPWAARLLVSATLEKPVQRRIATEVPEMTPVRQDLDYSTIDLDPYTTERLTANVDLLKWEELPEYIDLGKRALSWMDL